EVTAPNVVEGQAPAAPVARAGRRPPPATSDWVSMLVSIVAGPATPGFLQKLAPLLAGGRLAVFDQPAGSEPEEIIRRLTAIAEEGAIDHLIIACEPERPLMAYASLFADARLLPQKLGRVAFI